MPLRPVGHPESGARSAESWTRLHLLTTFYDTAVVDASLYAYQPLDFDVGGGWPGLAKKLLAIVLLVVVPLVALVALLVSFATQRRRTWRGTVGRAES